VYDSKKSGAMTTSHLRFGPRPIRSAYLVRRANFIACHQFVFTEKYEMLDSAVPGAVFLLNSPYGPDDVWDHLPVEMQTALIEKKLRFFVIDGYKVAQDTGMGGRVNTIMQTCFFAISGVLPKDEAIERIKYSVKKTYGKKGDEIVRRNWGAIDHTLEHLFEVRVPESLSTSRRRAAPVTDDAPDFVKKVTATILFGQGDKLPVSAFEADGTWPMATTQYEKRNIALEIPVWDPSLCIQCTKCSAICPHAAIRAKIYDPALLADAPESFKSVDARGKEFKGMRYTIQVAPEDCTGCGVCVATCPARDKADPKRKAIHMAPQMPLRAPERENYTFFLNIPDFDRTRFDRIDLKASQLMRPLFEYSGACGGCGETPYVKLLTQLFGDRLLIANATGCSSIYGGNLPTTPYAVNHEGRGPAWANSLFEDNAEYGFGFRLALDKHKTMAREYLALLSTDIGEPLVDEILREAQTDETGIQAQRGRVALLKKRLASIARPEARRLADIADYLVRKSVWILGGDGWAYDIGYGGLDHVVGNMRDVNILVMDTEVYSNTGGQQSKATPIGASAKFAAAGKENGKKDLGLMAMSYRNAYVASVALGANDAQTVKAFLESDSWDGPSLVIAYSHCIAHGYDLQRGPEQQKAAVNAGVWPLYRYDPRRVAAGEAPLKLDSPANLKGSVLDYMLAETRFRTVEKMYPERFRRLAASAQQFTQQRIALYQQLATVTLPKAETSPDEPKAE
jgi:pyruvate-ferredoxin/flavodoxin oxidoreductase